ncbi:MAG: histidinol dehydrogenase [Gammaproteobacteria bacterium]|nr:histidinol dehydrogenase [Gammaproteobacteria bacterium]MBU2069878.1 histidinol dehydrogenase [Gammaproteobacteria bacterium]MBU2184840.1 histidinol dehydrogenase [Gammaproteobacteria bacterium]MBU2204376.1 histidinol dehydrogenase [Gammaproteobacteria bacterium]
MASVFNWAALSESEQQAALARPKLADSAALGEQVRAIIDTVRQQGDDALVAYSQQFDGLTANPLRLTVETRLAQLNKLLPERKAAIELAYDNIRKFHAAQLPRDIEVETSAGVVCQLKSRAIAAVGLYIPGGSAPLPSTVLMLGVPAQLAGCSRIVLVTPPGKPAAGDIAAEILYAAELCGINEIYTIGGAQAIAALAYGTQSIAKVDKIFGPGNRYVTEAKQQVSQDAKGAQIDMPAGPSEVLVLADNSANAAFVAADLLSQAEHGPDSQVILVSDSSGLIAAVQAEVASQLSQLPRKDIAEAALSHSRYILTADLAQAVAVTNAYAPEHLIVQTASDDELVSQFNSAASIFVGKWTPESAGDYASGTNHVLPTYGYSKTVSSLSLTDFYRRFTVQKLSEQGMRNIGPAIVTLAEAESLDAHANAVRLRLAELTTIEG